jgi:hypothetical protein
MKRKRKTSNRNKIPDGATGDDPELAAVDEKKQKFLEERVREALAEPDEPTTFEEFKRRMDELAMADGYLNDFHRERSERLKANLAKQPKATLKQALAQYERIKQGSKRRAENESSAGRDSVQPKQEQA